MPDIPFVVGVAPSGRSWRGALQRHVHDHVSDVMVRVVRDLDGARLDHLDILVVDDDTSFLSLPMVTELHRQGIEVIGVFDPAESDGYGQRHLELVGVGTQLDGSLDPEHLLDELRSHRRDPAVEDRFADLIGGVDPSEHRLAVRSGLTVAVGGPAGAGRTEVAIALAVELGRPGARSLLVDADEVGPSVARRLGLAVHPNLITALEILRGGHPELEGVPADLGVARAVAHHDDPRRTFDTIAGIGRRLDWSLLDPDEISLAIDEFRRRWPAVVLDCGPMAEDLDRWVDRFACTRTCLSVADRVIGVLDGSPTGLVRFLDWLTDATELGVRSVEVAVNRSPGGARQRIELETELRDSAGPTVGALVHLPGDGRVVRSAWDATTVCGARFRRGISRLAAEVAIRPAVGPVRVAT